MESNTMTVEDLLKPRYKVIADYPGSNFNIGDILHNPEYFDKRNSNLNKYPAIFKPLSWWEDRKPEEMPEYVKFTKEYMEFKKGDVYKTTPRKRTDSNGEFIYFLIDGSKPNKFIDNKIGVPPNFNQLLPATETEYLNQNKNDKP